jgi:hypothetical protein
MAIQCSKLTREPERADCLGGLGESGEVKRDQVKSRGSLGDTKGNSGFSRRNLNIGLLAELADALDSKSNARKGVSVQLR